MTTIQDSGQGVPAAMRAIRLHSPGGPAGLRFEQVETPRPKEGEALIRVHAAAITRGELDWPTDRLPAIPSYEFSGVVVAAPSGASEVSIGDPVFALSSFDRDGAAAEYIAVGAVALARKPARLGFIESAAVPLAALSAWQALFDHGHLEEGERVLILGAAGGVGSFAVQLAHEHGAHVIGTASTRNIEVARELGADQVIDSTRTRFEEAMEAVDLVFDTVGGDRLERSLEVLREGGRLVSVSEEPPRERAAARGITAAYFVVEPNREQLRMIAQQIDDGRLRPFIDQVYPLADARKAFERSLGDHGAGKIVLRVADEAQ
jgi:NADPH:quinone reductase-like Zn-dependent oxidoreductase